MRTAVKLDLKVVIRGHCEDDSLHALPRERRQIAGDRPGREPRRKSSQGERDYNECEPDVRTR